MKPKDYRTELEPVWCARCGDFGVLKGLTQALSDLEVPPEKLGVISGIGCSSRLPGYLRAYSFNSIHGRALPIASGLKLSRPELTVVVVGGDGDGFSIGLGHIPHAIRRNVDLTYLVLDNGIYGLTKGQASPTTSVELKQSLGLAGGEERPLNPVFLVLSSGCGFVARAPAGHLPPPRAVAPPPTRGTSRGPRPARCAGVRRGSGRRPARATRRSSPRTRGTEGAAAGQDVTRSPKGGGRRCDVGLRFLFRSRALRSGDQLISRHDRVVYSLPYFERFSSMASLL